MDRHLSGQTAHRTSPPLAEPESAASRRCSFSGKISRVSKLSSRDRLALLFCRACAHAFIYCVCVCVFSGPTCSWRADSTWLSYARTLATSPWASRGSSAGPASIMPGSTHTSSRGWRHLVPSHTCQSHDHDILVKAFSHSQHCCYCCYYSYYCYWCSCCFYSSSWSSPLLLKHHTDLKVEGGCSP